METKIQIKELINSEIEGKFNEVWSNYLNQSTKRIDRVINERIMNNITWKLATEIYLETKKPFRTIDPEHNTPANIYFFENTELAINSMGVFIKTNDIGELYDEEFIFIPMSNITGLHYYNQTTASRVRGE